MRRLSLLPLIFAVLLIGCGKKDKDTIVYEVFPTEVVVIPSGESKDVKVGRKGGKELKDLDLQITSSDPKVMVEGGKFKGDAKEAMITIKTAADTPDKEHTITVKAGDVTKTFKVRVEKAGKMDVDPMVKEDASKKKDLKKADPDEKGK